MWYQKYGSFMAIPKIIYLFIYLSWVLAANSQLRHVGSNSQLGSNLRPLSLGMLILNHRTTRKFPPPQVSSIMHHNECGLQPCSLKNLKISNIPVYTQNANLFTNSAQMEMFESSISTFSLQGKHLECLVIIRSCSVTMNLNNELKDYPVVLYITSTTKSQVLMSQSWGSPTNPTYNC